MVDPSGLIHPRTPNIILRTYPNLCGGGLLDCLPDDLNACLVIQTTLFPFPKFNPNLYHSFLPLVSLLSCSLIHILPSNPHYYVLSR